MGKLPEDVERVQRAAAVGNFTVRAKGVDVGNGPDILAPDLPPISAHL